MNFLSSFLRNQQPLLRSVFLMTLILTMGSFSHVGEAQEVIRLDDAVFSKRISLSPQLLAFEDTSGVMTIDDVLAQSPFSENFKVGNPRGIYWMKFTLENTSSRAIDIVYLHSRMSSAKLYKVNGDSVLFESKSGEYLKRSEFEMGQSRYHLTFRLSAQTKEDFYVRIQNTRDRGPKMFVLLEEESTFYEEKWRKSILDFLWIGGLAIFVFYAFSLYIIHGSRPYFWLSLMVLSFAVYTLAINGYLTDLFFPEQPKLSKTFSPPLGQFGKFCMLMLLLSFLEVKKNYSKWYRVFMALIVMYAIRIVYMYYVTIVYEDFGLSTLIGAATTLATNVIYIAFIISVFRKLNMGKKVFAAGLMLYAIGILMVSYFWVFQPFGRAAASLISSTVTIIETLMFFVALGIEMRQHEIDKNLALDELNTTLSRQNQKIESEVIDRTKEINTQKMMLEERNERIETLFKEVHHRVKNNLQLISSLLNMQQEWSNTEDPAKAIEDSRSRVVAMSMIHQFLYRTDDISTIDFKQYTEELAQRLDAIQVEKVSFDLDIQFDKAYTFDIDTSISLGLILNELITNSYKHALLDKRSLKIGIRMEDDNSGYFKLVYSDNGNAIKEPFAEVVKKGFGLRLASRLSRQLQGRFEYSFKEYNIFTVTFANQALREQIADD